MDLIMNCNRYIVARGFNYYKKKLIKDIKQIKEITYKAVVTGSNNYNVIVDLKDYTKCKCTCPYNKKICKHIIALYFTLKPYEASNYESMIKGMIKSKNEYDKRKKEEYLLNYNNAVEYVNSLSSDEIKEELISRIIGDNYYNMSDYGKRYEEKFSILDEIDLSLLSDNKVILPKLSDFINAFELITEGESWINIKTCEVYDEYDFEDMDEDEVDGFLENDYIIALPSQRELDIYNAMANFTHSLEDKTIKDRLYNALKGKGSYKLFKNEIMHLNIRDKWFNYRDEWIKEKVIQWLNDNEIEYDV